MRRTLCLAVLGLAFLQGCADPTRSSDEAPRAADGGDLRYRATAMVLENEEHQPMLCLGLIRDSLPPQCGDVPITNWDWNEVQGEERLRGTTWAVYQVVGTYDGRSFTVQDVKPPDESTPTGDPYGPFATPCPEPEGGWVAPDPGRTSEKDLQAAVRAAEGEEDSAGVWVSHEGRSDPQIPGETVGTVLNVAFTGNLERHEAELRELWGGPLCVTRHERTLRELTRIQRELTRDTLEQLGLQDLGSGIDVSQNVVVLEVVTSDAEREAALDQRFGEDSIRVWPALRSVP